MLTCSSLSVLLFVHALLPVNGGALVVGPSSKGAAAHRARPDAVGSGAEAGDEPWPRYQPQPIDGATPPVIDLSSGVFSGEQQQQQQQQLDRGSEDTVADSLAASSGSASPSSDGGPSFDPTTERNVTVLVGRTAHLHCRVRNLGNRTVSWIRHRDVHILTVGGYNYATDQRFSIVGTRPSEDWTLQIKFTQVRDAGLYECQVSTQPHRSQFVRLNVVAPKAVILGGPEFHVDVGSHVNLTCVVQFSPEPPEYIFWHHHDQELRHDSSRGGVAIVTDKTNPMTSTSLLLRQVRLSDSGKYSCTPSNADPASVTLHVLQGERPAAMQSNSAPIAKGTMEMASSLLCSVAASLLALASSNWRHRAPVT